ncbi:MAG TPA: permease prefix domain 1-containing protein [Verrucomicrobiae bacterium]|nr:permease prefix domain 1-containing protein [Verrucomicrobiae bacterium]
MKEPSPFDLNHSIQEWRESLAKSPAFSRENLDELESHLRDSVHTLVETGLSKQQAFQAAVQRCGNRKQLATAFKNASPIGAFRKLLAVTSALLALMFGAVSYWLFYLTDGRYAISRPDGSILYVVTTTRGWLIFLSDVLITLVLLWVASRLLKRSRRRVNHA